ncbi:MAG: S41 family peptidase [Alphaproteobacteria bacterium]
MKLKSLLTPAAIALMAAAALTTTTAPAMAQGNSDSTYDQLELFSNVFERVRSDYVDEKTDRELIEAAIAGMLTSLDPHSTFLPKEAFEEMQVDTKGEFGGLGIEVNMKDGYVQVVSPIDDTPAFRAGLQPGDLITHLDGEQVLGLTLQEAVEKMRGPKGAAIKLTIRREGTDPFEVSITRDIITIRSARWEVEDGNIGYIRLTSFTQKTMSGLEEAVNELRDEIGDDNLTGYILDLRNNPGGLLDQAIKVSDALLDQGEIVSIRGRYEEDARRWSANEGDLTNGKPIVVLINGGSASASEIVAGALKDHRRAILMGTKSFGKGSVQTILPVGGASGNAMKLTTARYYTPSGTSIQATGIEPDIEVKPARLEEIDLTGLRREADLRGRLDNPEDGEAESQSEDGAEGEAGSATPLAEDEIFDYQLERAKDILKGLALYGDTVKR